jgi:hypothetical protein
LFDDLLGDNTASASPVAAPTYRQAYGAVLSRPIDQHIYVTIHQRFDPSICGRSSRTDVAITPDLVRGGPRELPFRIARNDSRVVVIHH